MSGDDEVERIAREYAPNAKPSEKIHVQRVEVIYVEWLAGAGTESEPYRTCQAYFTMGGEAIAVADPFQPEKPA